MLARVTRTLLCDRNFLAFLNELRNQNKQTTRYIKCCNQLVDTLALA